MASSDAGTSSGAEYQVFLSFRGPDTRISFTDFLYHSLIDAGIHVFRDDEELRIGERIDGSLEQAINNSRIYIPVLSQSYASSKWCLLELEQIMANISKSKSDKVILPIFFDVEPDDVKLKTVLYTNAIQRLQSEKKLSNEQIDAWKEALKKVGAMKGWEVKKYNGHGKLIKLVIEDVVKKLKRKHRLVSEYLVGIDDQVEAINKLLDINSDDVRFIKIYGMGGIGKTTLAKVVFNQVSSHFGRFCCFLEDVREKSLRTDDLVEMQKKLLSEIGVDARTTGIGDVDYGMQRIGEVLSNKKVLIVLDDVDKSEQVEKLVGKSTLCSGSRILITTRKNDLLRTHRRQYRILYHEMEVMSTDCAFELFSRHAFNSDSPFVNYKDLSRRIVFATGRLPLALEVIGSFLYGKEQPIWQETLEKLNKAPHEDVFQKLKISYDALSSEQKHIFLDVACLFIGMDKTDAIYMWKDHGISANTGVDVLVNMSLVKIVWNKFWMHDQLRDFGRKIVCQKNQRNPGKRSRLWIDKEILDPRKRKKMNNIQALGLTLDKSNLDLILSDGRFEHLMRLKLNGKIPNGDMANSLNNLSWIFWSEPPQIPFKQTNMHSKNVVFLRFSLSPLIDDSTLQSVIKMTGKLKILSLEYCYHISKTPDFSGCPKLERLTFEGCSNLKIDSSIGKLKCLIYLRIYDCYGFEDLPEEIGDLMNLQHLSIQQCKVKKLPDSIWKLKSLREVHFKSRFRDVDSTDSWELPSIIRMLHKLEVLLVNNEYLKGRLPYEIGSFPFLRILDLSYTRVREVPKTVNKLPGLQRLTLRECHEIQELPALPTSLTHLLVSSKSLRVVPNLSNLTNLVELDLHGWEGRRGDQPCNGSFWWIGGLPKPTEWIFGHQDVSAPIDLASLPMLNQLYFYGLDLQKFPELPLSLQTPRHINFNAIGINMSYFELFESPLEEIHLEGSKLPNIRELHVVNCVLLKRFRLSGKWNLKVVDVLECPKLVEIRFLWEFKSMEVLSIQRCQSLERLVGSVRQVSDDQSKETISRPSRSSKELRRFIVGGCPQLFEIYVVDLVESLQCFILIGCPNVPDQDFKSRRTPKIFARFGNDGPHRFEAFLHDYYPEEVADRQRRWMVYPTGHGPHCHKVAT